MRMVDQELQQLELALGQVSLAVAVADHRSFGIEAQALQVPEALVPELEPLLVPGHLVLDDLEIDRSGALRVGQQLRYVAPDALKQPRLEAQEVGVDRDPVARILP